MKFKEDFNSFMFPYNQLSQMEGVLGEIGKESGRYNNESGTYVNVVFPLYGEIVDIPINYLEVAVNAE